MTDDDARSSGKRDRLARMLRVAAVLQAHPDGIRPPEIARRVGVTTRTVYRDLHALEDEVEVKTWSADGLWGVVSEAFLPPLKLTLDEAMAVVLSARLMVRYADKYDPDLAAAFEKLEDVLPPALADHVERTMDVLAEVPRDADFNERVHRLTRAWAERRVVTFQYEPAALRAGCRAAPGGRPPLPHRAVAADPRPVPHRLRRDARRAAHVQGRADPRRRPHPAHVRAARARRARADAPAGLGHHRRPARDGRRAALRPERRRPRRARRRGIPSQRLREEPDGALRFRVTVAGPIEIRLWILSWGDAVEVLEPAELRADVAATHARAAARYEGGRPEVGVGGQRRASRGRVRATTTVTPTRRGDHCDAPPSPRSCLPCPPS